MSGVSRVYGKVDGVDIILHQNERGLWQVQVPSDVDGIYILEISAEDFAGNTTYLTRTLFEVRHSVITTTTLLLGYWGEVIQIYKTELQPNLFVSEMTSVSFVPELQHMFTVECVETLYSAELLPP